MQRSMTGGFLIEDAKLLNANARSMFAEAGHRFRAAPDIEPHGAGRLHAAKRSTQALQKPAVS